MGAHLWHKDKINRFLKKPLTLLNRIFFVCVRVQMENLQKLSKLWNAQIKEIIIIFKI